MPTPATRRGLNMSLPKVEETSPLFMGPSAAMLGGFSTLLPGSLAQASRSVSPRDGAALGWREWAARYASTLLSADYAPHHEAAWQWAESLRPGVSPETLVLAWNRGAAKSGTFQGWCCRWAFTLNRRFPLAVTETQEQASRFVSAVAEQLAANGIEPARNPLGASRGWRKDMIRTADGFNLMAVGWDVATRGIRLGELRPDVILFDDVDGRLDTPATTEKKQTVLTQTFLPAGAPGLAVAFGQNVILRGGLMDQLVQGQADFLTNRRVSFVRAVEGLEIGYRDAGELGRVPYIAAGASTWPARLSIPVLDGFLAAMGVRAFMREFQHDVGNDGEFFRVSMLEIVDAAPAGLPSVRRWDVAATAGAGDHTAGVRVEGPDSSGLFYVSDVQRGQWATDERNRIIRQTAETDGKAVRVIVPQDPGSAGVDSARAFVRLLAGFNVTAERESGSKDVRADPFSAQVNAGNVRLVRGAWNRAFIDELRDFMPGIDNRADDQVDAAAGAFNALANRKRQLRAL